MVAAHCCSGEDRETETKRGGEDRPTVAPPEPQQRRGGYRLFFRRRATVRAPSVTITPEVMVVVDGPS
ncbi:hypothetical protein HanXRQr2_Chr13g0568951 [Helianthus annuus]|uniref:Uncharacterized protein n=1 Tax=Helianthus annuus TaxID=4232 RepID=A0A9K3EGA4_HELAN|nr:hypothetical protein HanXRQr2_Chr13g0568951 [Helianthus annuus]